ncbi:MAG: AI-2E family transporter [Deltaproteobacteria bacterium]|nr:AI-2E family transporter [Deltaproteobacteria bacterium]
MSTAQPARRFFFILLTAATILFALVARPLASALFLAAVLAGVLWPAHCWLSARFRGRRGLSAAAFVLGVIILLMGPVVAFSAFAIKEGSEGVRYLSQAIRSEGVTGLVERLPQPLAGLAKRGLDQLPAQDEQNLGKTVQKQVSAQGGKAAAVVGATLSATGALVFQAVMMLIAFYFLLLQGDQLVAWLDHLSPLKRGQTRELMAEFKKVSYAVLLSTIITSAVQAVAALLGYFIGRVPHPIFFAGVTFFAAFIPAIGAGAVCLVAALLLFATGHPYSALFLAIWGLLVVGLVDNLVKPLLIKGGMEMNGAVVFFALIGGLSAFGAVGLLLGPLVVTLFLSLLRMYQRDFKTAV